MNIRRVWDDLFEMLGENVNEDGDLVREENAVGVIETALTGAADHIGGVDDRLRRKRWRSRGRGVGSVRDEDEDAEKLLKRA